jgi:hypothetical protein
VTEQRELERRVRGVYDLVRAQEPRAERRTPAAALDALLRAADTDERDADALRTTGLCGAFTPGAARRALALAGRPFACGTLVVTDGERDLALLFTTSGVKVLAAGFRLPGLARRLTEKGRVRTEELARLDGALKKHRGEQEALVAIGVNPDLVSEAAIEVAGQTVLDALFWSEPEFEAAAGEADPELRDRRDVDVLTLNARAAKALVQSVTERLNDMAAALRALPSLRVTLKEGPRWSERDGVSERGGQLVALVGKRSGLVACELPDRLAEAGHGRPPLHVVAKELQELFTKGVLASGGPAAIAERAHAPEAGLSALPRRLWLAKLQFDAGDRRAAARHLSRAGTHLLGRGRASDAARCLAAAHALHAEDIEAHDGYVKALLACERKDEARLEAEALARRYLDARLPGRARRALHARLQEREDTPLLLLHLEAIIALGEARPLTDVAEKVIARLRQEGHRREAQALADDLIAVASDARARERLQRAGGVRAGSPVVGRVAAGLVAALALGLLPAVRGLNARAAYARAAAEASATLARDPSAFERVEALFAEAAAAGDPVGAAARRAQERARDHAMDRDALQQVRRALGAGDVDGIIAACNAVKPRTLALKTLLADLHADAAARHAQALRASEELGLLVSRGDEVGAYACARRLLAEYKDVPSVLRGFSLPVRITSNPGAQLRWNRAAFAQSTPFQASLPLFEERHVEVSLAGHETVTRTLDVTTLDGPDVHITLRPASATPPPVSDWAGVLVRDGVLRGEEGPTPRFAQPTRPLSGVQVPARWRARVDAVHEQRQGKLLLVSLVITLEERSASGWTAERPVSVALPTPLVRAAVAQADGARAVPALERTAGLDLGWVREQVQRAVTYVLDRRGQGGGGR